MTRDEAISYIREHGYEFFKVDKSGKGYICPICGSGSGKNGTGITTQDNVHFTCWRGCFMHEDIFGIIGIVNGCSNDFNEQFRTACEFFRLDIDSTDAPKTIEHVDTKTESKNDDTAKCTDYTEFYNMAAQNLPSANYFRGISLDTLKAFHVGYVKEWRHPKAPLNVPTSPRLIIPISKMCYLARDTRNNLTEQQQRYSKSRIGNVELFNRRALWTSNKPVYVVEGEIDAMSIVDVGGQAVGLGSTSNIKKLIEAIKAQPPEQPLIISLDNDKAGQVAMKALADELNKMNFSSYRIYKLPAGYKDANDFLMNSPDEFSAWVYEGEIRDEEREAFEQDAVPYHLNSFLQTVENNRQGQAISTGFKSLDDIFDGGLYSGLYCIGAISSLGKTTFTLQIGDNIAQTGRGVLVFSLEMSRNELIAKTLSRLSLLKSLELYGNLSKAKTTRGILKGDYNREEREIIIEAIQEYSQWGQKLHITEGIGNVGVAEITDKLKQYMKFNDGEPPVIIIDYLQILAPYSEKATDKQNVDKNILELKRLSRDYDTPIIGISSFNRENYNEPVSMASFKESGAIEYSSDVLIGLQYAGYDYQDKEIKGQADNEHEETDKARKHRLRKLNKYNAEKAKNLDSQQIQLKILKSRNGVRGDLFFNFWPAFNYFSPIKENKA